MTPKEGNRRERERERGGDYLGQLTLSLRPQARTSPSPRALHTARQRQPTHNHPATRHAIELNTGASLEQIAPHPRPSLGPSRSLDRLSQVLPHPSFGRGGEPNLCAIPRCRQPARRCTQFCVVDLFPGSGRRRRRTRERCCPTRYRTSQGCFPLLPSQVTANPSRAPLWLRVAVASPFFDRWALGGARELARPPPGSCFRQSLVGWDGDGCYGKEDEAETGTDTCQRCAPPPSKIASCEVRWMTPGILRGPPPGAVFCHHSLAASKQATRAAKNCQQGQAIIVPTMGHSPETETGSAPPWRCHGLR